MPLNNRSRVYFISGLAADQRVFKYISLPASIESVFISWIKPHRKETLSSYAGRMAEKIDIKESFSLVGLSFGGMIATEISNQLKVDKTILISSIPTIDQLPVYYKIAGSLGLHRVMPISLLKKAARLKRLFARESPEDQVILKEMIRDSNVDFIRWAFQAVLTWQNRAIPSNLFQVHGTKDEILPIKYTRPTHVVKNGSHLMVLTRPREVNEILRTILES